MNTTAFNNNLGFDHLDVAAPLLQDYHKKPPLTSKHIFKLRRADLCLFFTKKHLRMPDNEGEVRTALTILRDCGYNEGVCKLLNTNSATGILGDEEDIKRRQKLFGRNQTFLPKIQDFRTLLAR